jgi:hypothetical protein
VNSRNYATINNQILLEYLFFSNGLPANIYAWNKIEIFDDNPQVNQNANIIQTIFPADISNPSTGKYQAIMSAVTIAKTYYDKITYTDWNNETVVEYNSIVVSLALDSGKVRQKSGFSYSKPDLTYNNGWGNIITPDEIRFKYLFGNPLVAQNGEAMGDDAIQLCIDSAIAMVEKDLNINLVKRSYKARGTNLNDRTDLVGTPEIDYEWDEAYDFDRETFNNKYIYIKLRHRPITKVYQVIFRDPLNNNVADITGWCKPNYERGSLEFFPTYGNLLMMFLQSSYFAMGNFIGQTEKYPDAFYIDYDAGLTNVLVMRKKYPELFEICGCMAAISAILWLSIGKASGIASQSISMEGISESISTTASAENFLMAAEALAYTKRIDKFYKENKYKYSGIQLGCL